MSGSLKKFDVSVSKPECLVGLESLGGGEGDAIFRGLWLRLRESSRMARAFPSLVGGEDCIGESGAARAALLMVVARRKYVSRV